MGEQQGSLKENKREKIEKKNFFFNLTTTTTKICKYIQDFLWSCCSQCRFSSILDSSFLQLTLLDIYRPLSGVVGVAFRDFNLLHRTFLKRFPLFIWLLFAVSSVSNFCPEHRRAEVVSYLGSLVQFSPAAGRAGRCRQLSLCVGSTRRVLARQPAVLGASPRVSRAFFPPQRAARAAREIGRAHV